MEYTLAIAVPERRRPTAAGGTTGDSSKSAHEGRRKSAIKTAKANIKAQLAAEGYTFFTDLSMVCYLKLVACSLKLKLMIIIFDLYFKEIIQYLSKP